MLKAVELLLIGAYMVGFQWVTFMYILGGLYQPIIAFGTRNFVPFELFVIGLTALVVGLIIFKIKQHQFGMLVLQNIATIILAVPLFIFIMLVFKVEVNYQHNFTLPNTLVFVLTFLTASINDWKKGRMSAANKTYSA